MPEPSIINPQLNDEPSTPNDEPQLSAILHFSSGAIANRERSSSTNGCNSYIWLHFDLAESRILIQEAIAMAKPIRWLSILSRDICRSGLVVRFWIQDICWIHQQGYPKNIRTGNQSSKISKSSTLFPCTIQKRKSPIQPSID